MTTRAALIGVVTTGLVAAGCAAPHQPDHKPADPKPMAVEPLPEPKPVGAGVGLPKFAAAAADAPALVEPPKPGAQPLPPSNTPTLPPAKRLGDRRFLGPNPYGALAASRDGAVIAFTAWAGSGKGYATAVPAITVWDVTAAKAVRQFGGVGEPVGQLALSPDGRTLFAGVGAAGHFRPVTVRSWDVATGKPLRERAANLWALSADGKTLATVDVHPGDIDPGIRLGGGGERVPPRSAIALWDAKAGTLRRAFEYTAFVPDAVALSPDGSKLVCGAGSATIGFDAETGKALWRTELADDKRYAGQEHHFAFAPDGKAFAAWNTHIYPGVRTVYLVDAATGKKRALVARSEASSTDQPAVRGVGFTPDSKTLYVGMGDGVVPVEVATGKMPDARPADPQRGWKWQEPYTFRRRGIQPDDLDYLYAFALSGDGTRAFLGGWFEKDACGLRVIDVATKAVTFPPKKGGQLEPPFPLAPAFPEPAEAFEPRYGYPQWSQLPDGRWLFQGNAADRYKLRLENAKREKVRDFGRGEVKGFAVTPDAETVATYGFAADKDKPYAYDTAIRLWDVETGKEWPGGIEFKQLVVPSNRPMFRVSPDGRTLAAVSDDGAVWLWEVATLKPRLRLDPAGPESIHVVAFSRDGRHLVSGDPTGQTGVDWDLAAAAGDGNAQAPDEKELAALWGELKGDDAARAYRAVWRLASHPAVAVPFLKGKAKDVPAVADAARLAARPFDPEVVLTRRVVEALELAGRDATAAVTLLKELADRPAFKVPAADAVKRLTARQP